MLNHPSLAEGPSTLHAVWGVMRWDGLGWHQKRVPDPTSVRPPRLVYHECYGYHGILRHGDGISGVEPASSGADRYPRHIRFTSSRDVADRLLG